MSNQLLWGYSEPYSEDNCRECACLECQKQAECSIGCIQCADCYDTRIPRDYCPYMEEE